MCKKCLFCLFRSDAQHRNLKRNENEMTRKQNEKEAGKICKETKKNIKGTVV
jgi:hypothetical protein